MRVHEIGRPDCKHVRPPKIPCLTRESQSYTLAYRPKQPTDWELNRYNVELKKKGSGAQSTPVEMISKSNYGENFRFSSPAEMRRAKQKPRFSAHGSTVKPTDSIVTASHTQTIHSGPQDGVEAGCEKVLPIHNIEIDGATAPDFWRSRYRAEHGDQLPPMQCSGQSPKWRKRQGNEMVETFLGDMLQSIRQMNVPPDRSVKKPVNLLGTDWQRIAALE